MAKPKASPTAQPLADKVGKTTSDGYGTRSRPRRRGKKPLRGQGK